MADKHRSVPSGDSPTALDPREDPRQAPREDPREDPREERREASSPRGDVGASGSEDGIESSPGAEIDFDPRRTPPGDPEDSERTSDQDTQATRNTIAALERERDDYYDRWLRKSAEFDNYRKRIDRERREQTDQAILELLRELLLVVDDFDLALAVEAGEAGAPFKKGVEMIHAKVHDLLKKYGVRPIEVLGAAFDPNVHQAVSHEASPGHRDGEVIDELRRGYMIKERLLRPAMVKVAKA
jgi:molecular chaperone GrpE